MLRVRWPVTAIATRSGTPARTMFRAAARRRSWNSLSGTPAAWQAVKDIRQPASTYSSPCKRVAAPSKLSYGRPNGVLDRRGWMKLLTYESAAGARGGGGGEGRGGGGGTPPGGAGGGGGRGGP